jgi:hypothetical protein
MIKITEMWEKKNKNGLPTGIYRFHGNYKQGEEFVENVVSFFDPDASHALKKSDKAQSIWLNDLFYDCFFWDGFYDCIEFLEQDKISVAFEEKSDRDFVVHVETYDFRHPLFLKIVNALEV